ncbi:MAG: heme-binding domain-containing protein [Polyangiaceae bacterium]
MKKLLKLVVAVLVLAFIAIQFIRPTKNEGEEVTANQIAAAYPVPDPVQRILKVSCYDCHSNTTHYPWYSAIQPAAWFLNRHIVEGKGELNFSVFATYAPYRQYKKFKEIGKQVKGGDMPLSSYTLVHRDASLTPDQKVLIQNWAADAMKQMEAKYPAESLVKPK